MLWQHVLRQSPYSFHVILKQFLFCCSIPIFMSNLFSLDSYDFISSRERISLMHVPSRLALVPQQIHPSTNPPPLLVHLLSVFQHSYHFINVYQRLPSPQPTTYDFPQILPSISCICTTIIKLLKFPHMLEGATVDMKLLQSINFISSHSEAD